MRPASTKPSPPTTRETRAARCRCSRATWRPANAENGEIGTPDPVRERPNASFDLGLARSSWPSASGAALVTRSQSGNGGTTPQQDAEMGQRNQGVECALRILCSIAGDRRRPSSSGRAPITWPAISSSCADYKAAVKEYESALRLIPGVPPDAGDSIGSDAAYNRAIALRRIEDKENKDRDASPPDGGNPDSGEPDGGEQPDSGKNQDKDGGNKDDKKNDDKKKDDQDKQKDAGSDAGTPKPKDQQPDGGPEQQKQKPEPQPSSTANQDDRMLDMLEHAPTMQEQDAKNRAVQGRTRSGMEDK